MVKSVTTDGWLALGYILLLDVKARDFSLFYLNEGGVIALQVLVLACNGLSDYVDFPLSTILDIVVFWYELTSVQLHDSRRLLRHLLRYDLA